MVSRCTSVGRHARSVSPATKGRMRARRMSRAIAWLVTTTYPRKMRSYCRAWTTACTAMKSRTDRFFCHLRRRCTSCALAAMSRTRTDVLRRVPTATASLRFLGYTSTPIISFAGIVMNRMGSLRSISSWREEVFGQPPKTPRYFAVQLITEANGSPRCHRQCQSVSTAFCSASVDEGSLNSSRVPAAQVPRSQPPVFTHCAIRAAAVRLMFGSQE